MLERVAVNLLSNAVKFTPDGGTITIALERCCHGAVLQVRDEGIGIPEDEQGELLVVARGGSVSRLVSAAVCTLSISPARASFGATGGSGVLSVSVEPDCRWTVRSDAAWLMPTTSVGNGSADIGYTVAPYSGGAKKRVATLTVNGKVFTVTQSR